MSSASAFSFLRIALAALVKTAAPLSASASVAAEASFCLAFAASLAASFCANDSTRLCFPGPAPKTYFRYAGAAVELARHSRSARLAGRRFQTTSVRSKACSASCGFLDFSYLSSGGRAAGSPGAAPPPTSPTPGARRRRRRRVEPPSLRLRRRRAPAFARASFALSAALAPP